ncbi:MAG: hypothetical protein HC813_02570 [Planctomycetes bacterium]|nr:hypothetical protein [Planctomycetota bacterium]
MRGQLAVRAAKSGFGLRVHREVESLIETRQWSGSFVGRLFALLGGQRRLRRTLHRLAAEGRAEGVAAEEIRASLHLAREAHRNSLMAAHYEDLRALLGSWRYLHRWIALLMVLLVVVHVVHALLYGFQGGALP